MPQETELIIPDAFLYKPFYEPNCVIQLQKGNSIEDDISCYPFFYDILYSLEATAHQHNPWGKIDYYAPIIFQKWLSEKDLIAAFFRNRDKANASQPMIQHIANMIDIIYWINGRPITSLDNITVELQELSIKPINCQERIEFLLDNPVHYHAFIQLSELYVEIRKQYEKVLLKMRTK
ncbi:YpoC family protein [Bacillus sp. Marseille-P3661]|uniref:YpoC family protein n=1 Tax=Bacillus sp. Marseille-P3661 TaxID=1936234 RepID=UPI000C81FB7A|nr:hypothetical protein [Bacillus sp. Marseille-P3661]